MTQRKVFEDIRINAVASQCIQYLMIFQTEEYDQAVMGCGTQCREELILMLHDILSNKNEDYYRLVKYLTRCACGSEDVFGVKARNHISGEQYASNLLYEIEALDRPIYIARHSTLPDDF